MESLFYYSGHGCQLNHQSYLIPTNVDTKKASKIKYHALGVGELLDMLDRANNRVNMLFLDACRDVPVGSKGGTKGLGQISVTPKGTLVVYATEAGKVAEDNTLFISELTKTILKPNKKVWEIGNHLSNTIASKTNDRQIPEMFSKRLPSGLVLLRGERREVEEVVASTETVHVQPVKPTQQPTHSTKGITTINGKMWQDVPENKTMRLNWSDAMKYCEDLKLGGYSDWRLPSKEVVKNLYKHRNELKNIDNYVTSNDYWSSTTVVSDSSSAWHVNFNYGYDYWYSKTNENYVHCVRGGQQ